MWDSHRYNWRKAMKNKVVYSGKVSIKTRGKPPIRKHNSGTNVLFSLLSNLVSGIIPNDLTNKLPHKIAIIHDDSGNKTSESFVDNFDYESFRELSILTTELLISSRSVDNVYNSVRFSTLLPRSMLNDRRRSYAEGSKTLFVILLNMDEQIQAYSEVSYDDISEVWDNPIGQAKVEWDMFFANKEEYDE